MCVYAQCVHVQACVCVCVIHACKCMFVRMSSIQAAKTLLVNVAWLILYKDAVSQHNATCEMIELMQE